MRLDAKVVRALKRLKGEPLSRGVVELTAEYVHRRMRDYQKRLAELRAMYSSKKRLKAKVLKKEHTWEEETALFDWESLEPELKKFEEAAKELGL